ncbi:VOC family protein [Furfurilactobacillus sp. WILCCON 0119]
MDFMPYLTFHGQAAQALTFYRSIFGGELNLNRAGELFPDASDDVKNLIVHGTLAIPDSFTITALDVIPGAPDVTPGNTTSMGLHLESVGKAVMLFQLLADQGTVVLPLEQHDWGGYFGVLTDHFGVRWNIDA